RVGEVRLVPARHRRRGAQPSVDRSRREGVPPVTYLPQVGGRARDAVLLDRAEEEFSSTPSRGPEICVEPFVTQLAPGGLVREQDRPRFVELMLAPRGCERPVGPVTLQPQSLGLLRA